MTIRVALIADLIEERWYSMDRYADELLSNLTILQNNSGYTQFEFALIRPKRFFPSLKGKLGAILTLITRYLFYPLFLAGKKADIYHILDHSYAHLIKVLPFSRTIITCHDLAPLALNEQIHSLTFRLWMKSINLLSKARFVLTDSCYTFNDLQKFLNIKKQNIKVVH